MTSQRHLRWLLPALTVIAIGGLFQMILTAPAHPLQAYPPPGAPTAPNPYPPPGTPTAGPTPPLAPQTLLNPAAYFPLALRQWALPSPKKGLALTYETGWHYQEANRLNVSWFHNWHVTPAVEPPPSVEFIPFVRCAEPDEISAAVANLGADYDGYLLFLNEPDHDNLSQGCGITVEEAAQRYLSLRTALPDAKLIGPNPSWNDPNTTNYIEDWREAVHTATGNYPDVTGYGWHFYTTSVNAVRENVNNLCIAMNSLGEGDKEMWITEFGVDQQSLGEDAVKNTLFQLLDIFEHHVGLESGCEVTRYAYYTTRQRPAFAPGVPTPTVAPPTPSFAIGQYTDLYCHYYTTPTWMGEAYRVYGLVTPSPTPSPMPIPTLPRRLPTRTPTPSPTPTPPGG